ncbi:hypothetical protein [Rhizobium sp. BR 362]|uniref:hypothetical protein n=1 Tax=Rhizobium sp. BR 362 TaxID=3040670 RepID=UPI002F3EFC65
MATYRWIAHGDTVLLLGPTGTGKIRLAVDLSTYEKGAILITFNRSVGECGRVFGDHPSWPRQS